MDIFVFLLFHLALVASGPVVLQKHPGDNVTLSCQVDGGVSIRAVEWTREDLKPPKYILFYTNGHSDPTHQLSSFENRVQLANRELKNGNVSLILRNISINDNGTYECRVADSRSGRKKRAIIEDDPISRIQLEVSDSGVAGGDSKIEDTNFSAGNHIHVGLIAVLVLCSAVVVLVVGIVKKYKIHADNKSDQAAADKAGGDQLI